MIGNDDNNIPKLTDGSNKDTNNNNYTQQALGDQGSIYQSEIKTNKSNGNTPALKKSKYADLIDTKYDKIYDKIISESNKKERLKYYGINEDIQTPNNNPSTNFKTPIINTNVHTTDDKIELKTPDNKRQKLQSNEENYIESIKKELNFNRRNIRLDTPLKIKTAHQIDQLEHEINIMIEESNNNYNYYNKELNDPNFP